jgi:hypothetical protein
MVKLTYSRHVIKFGWLSPYEDAYSPHQSWLCVRPLPHIRIQILSIENGRTLYKLGLCYNPFDSGRMGMMMRWICIQCNSMMDKTNFTDFIKESDNDKNSHSFYCSSSYEQVHHSLAILLLRFRSGFLKVFLLDPLNFLLCS